MSRLEESRTDYMSIPIPSRLNQVVSDAIAQAEARRLAAPVPPTQQLNKSKDESLKPSRKKVRFPVWKYTAAVAVLLVSFAVGVNANPVLAAELKEVPVLGALVRLFTLDAYTKEDENAGILVEIPGLEALNSESNGLTEEVNEQIKEKCENYASEALERAKEYKEAFLATGGTMEEWEAHDIQIKVWYELKGQSDTYLSFVVSGAENWTSAYAENYYYNLDLTNMKYLTLKDLLGEDYIAKANVSIKAQIAEREKDGQSTFFTAQEGGFETITEATSFYINEKGNPVIVFKKYEIAPGFMGCPEFEIVR